MSMRGKIALFLLIALISGCSVSPQVATPARFAPCQRECAALLDAELPSCLSDRRVRDEVGALFGNADDVASRLDLPDGACGCLTARLTEDGGLGNIAIVHVELVADQRKLIEAFEAFRLSGPIPPEAGCMIGVAAPITFAQ
jgi:hypothetical protein